MEILDLFACCNYTVETTAAVAEVVEPIALMITAAIAAMIIATVTATAMVATASKTTHQDHGKDNTAEMFLGRIYISDTIDAYLCRSHFIDNQFCSSSI